MESITVSLEEGTATVSYDPSVTDPQTIAGEASVIIILSLVAGSHRCHYSPLVTDELLCALCLKCECVTLCLCFARPGQ